MLNTIQYHYCTLTQHLFYRHNNSHVQKNHAVKLRSLFLILLRWIWNNSSVILIIFYLMTLLPPNIHTTSAVCAPPQLILLDTSRSQSFVCGRHGMFCYYVVKELRIYMSFKIVIDHSYVDYKEFLSYCKE